MVFSLDVSKIKLKVSILIMWFSDRMKGIKCGCMFIIYIYIYHYIIYIFGAGLIEQRDSRPLLRLIESIGDWPVATDDWNITTGTNTP